ncbi:MAG: lyase family protein, partial [Anaerovoracaceae bacterium]|nr:lyase family protein [Anaerovoracaceae bacterium]
MANLWGGRFEKEMDEIVEKFNASIMFDKRLYKCDIKGSVAHANMLAAQGIINDRERDDIVRGLENIRDRMERGEFEFSVKQEDIHMAVEAALIEELGETGKKLHTARSRNDQVQTDMRLYIKEQIGEINSGTVEAGDWALISLKPFMSEERLTVTMKNGDQFMVKVTDAQISTNIITADGMTFKITVTYDEAAQIPAG